MQSKLGLVALSVMATLVLFGGNTAEAKSEATDKKPSVQTQVTVKSGDTLTDIATTHKTSYMRLFNANESITSPDLIFVDQKLRIPSKDEVLADRLAQFTAEQQAQIVAAAAAQQPVATEPVATVAPVAAAPAPAYQNVAASAARGSSAGNTYAYGWCTWYAKSMRPDLPNNLGNGGSWVANAAAQGIPTGTAQAGAIAEIPGHVAYVKSVNGGMMTISEMGWNYTQGQYNERTVPVAGWNFINELKLVLKVS